jgi:hypothetical protein
MIKEINKNFLDTKNHSEDIYIIKKFLDKKDSSILTNFFLNLIKKYKNEERIKANNWYSDVNKNKSQLKTFYLYDLKKLDNQILIKVFRKMYNHYKILEEKNYLDDFEKKKL